MANKRIIIKRRKSVRNIRKITRTMQLIATARFQAALARATATKPYTEKLAELAADLSAGAGELQHRLMQTNDDANRSVLLTITSNRGLCGGYNANVFRTIIAHLDDQKDADIETDTIMVGVKGINYFKFLKRTVAQAITHIDHKPKFEEVEPIANDLMARFETGEISSVHVVYMKYFSAGKQQPDLLQLLPLAQDDQKSTGDQEHRGPRPQFEFSPEPAALLNELLPATVRVRLFQCFTDAAVCEQIARMVAMKAATDAAEDMITMLTRKYNRARQTQITMELLDIVGGANALA